MYSLWSDSVSLSEGLGGRGPGVGGGRHGLPGARVHRVRDVREVSHRAPQYRGPKMITGHLILLANKTDTQSNFQLYILESLML